MDHLRPGGHSRRPSPQLPACCRHRLAITTTVRVSSLQQLLWLLWLVLALQLSTIMLVLAGPVPPRLSPAPATSRSLISAAAGSIPVTPRQAP